ncbi:MAG TPA: cytochrome d ubiquinol oxidase subunit II, partial [Paracoccaceae bacterium]|nr:cytochrome d ubiquinol oxidase subunit II [Paracoccaceae bacterium]
FDWPTVIFSALVPALILGCAWMLFSGLAGGHDRRPFFAAVMIFILCFAGIGISFYPYIVPPSLTIEDAAAPKSSLVFLLIGAAILIPIILAYTGHAYWLFRGKTEEDEGYN